MAFDSPDYFGYIAGGLKTFMDDHYIHDAQMKAKGLKGKPYALFYSHGGGDRVRTAMDIFSRVGTLIGDRIIWKARLGSSEPVQSLGQKARECG